VVQNITLYGRPIPEVEALRFFETSATTLTLKTLN